MAIFRCNKCGHAREVGNDYIGKSVKCPKCENVAKIHETLGFVNALIKKYILQTKELHKLREELSSGNTVQEISEESSFEDVDIYNTDMFTQDNSFGPIIEWFEKQNIDVQVDPNAVDTTGFFDEIALLLGNNFKVLSRVTNQIKSIQNKGYTNVKIDLAKRKDSEIQQITSFCQVLYDYSFVAKYYYHRKDNIIRLTLQMAPKIRSFFNGIWMEWFVLIKMLEFCRENNIRPACTRGINISFPGGNSNELDIFFLTEKGHPVCIECKSGEFRQDINKYLSLRKQLKLEKEQFVLCVFGLSQEQAQGMNSMYDLTFVNENTLLEHIQTVI